MPPSPQKLPFIQWCKDYSVGHAVLDQQHRSVIQVINQLYDTVESKKEVAESTLQSLVRYTRVHLTFEEKILEKTGYPELEKHKKLHEEMRRWSDTFLPSLTSSDDFNMEVLQFLRHWWLDHILTQDKKYAPFLDEHA